MKKIKLLLNIAIFSLVLSPSFSAPDADIFEGEDDEYDDDPELPERKEILLKLQEEMEKLQQEQKPTTTTPTTTTTTPKPHKIYLHRQKQPWVMAKDVRGYQVFSDGPVVHTELIKTKPMLRIRIDIPDTVRHVEKIYKKRYIELKIRNWNKVQKVHVKVPFGYEPEDLRIAEMKDYIDIVAPIYFDVDEGEEE